MYCPNTKAFKMIFFAQKRRRKTRSRSKPTSAGISKSKILPFSKMLTFEKGIFKNQIWSYENNKFWKCMTCIMGVVNNTICLVKI